MASATPPRRPRRGSNLLNDDFMTDIENQILEKWDARKGIPKGRRRFENAEWAELIKQNVYPHHSDIDWYEYVEWVKAGGGDEWFQEETPLPEAP